jgi:hypothetical protein
MNKTKIIALLLAIVVFSAVAVAQNEDSENESIEKDMREAGIMHFSLGSQVRLMQLQERVDYSILVGQHVLDVIDNKSFNVSQETLDRMEEIISELEDIKDTITNEISKNETDKSVGFFVETKENVINLTQEFKKLAWDSLTSEQRKEVRSSFDEDREEFRDYKEKIKEKVLEFNKEKAREMLVKLNVKIEDMIDRIDNGNFTAGELRQFFRNKFQEKNEEGKKLFLSRIKEERKEVELTKHMAFAKKLRLGENETERMKNIINNSEFNYGEVKAKLGVFVKERMLERNQRRQELRQDMKDKLQEMQQDRQQDRLQKKKGEQE